MTLVVAFPFRGGLRLRRVNVGPLEIVIVLMPLVAVLAGVRLALRRPRADPDARSTRVLAFGGWLLTAITFVVPLAFLAAFPVGGQIVSRAWVRTGAAIMVLSALAFVARIVQVATA